MDNRQTSMEWSGQTPLMAYLTVEVVTYLQPDVVLIRFQESPWGFEAGQFITLELRTDYQQTVYRRSYSLVNLPGEPLQIVVKRLPNGLASNYLFAQARPGLRLLVQRPTGMFTLSNGNPDHATLVLAGAGSGLTPLFAILRAALKSDQYQTIHWLVTDRTLEASLFYEEVEQLAIQYPDRLKLTYFITSRELPKADFQQPNQIYFGGHLSNSVFEQWLKQQATYLSGTDFYLCGPAALMQVIKFELRYLGVSAEAIHQEQFVIPTRPASQKQYAAQPAEIVDKGHFEILPNETLLQAGLRSGYDLPYSCQAGQCSACVARLVSGQVEHQYNEVLTDADLANGAILTCTAHPLNPVVWTY